MTSKVILFILILVIVILSPFGYHFDFGPGPDCINALVWQYFDDSWFSGFRFSNPLWYTEFIIV